MGASHQEAVNALRSAGDTLTLLLCDGYDPSEVEKLVTEGKITQSSKSASQSVSSLDRDDEDNLTLRMVSYLVLISNQRCSCEKLPNVSSSAGM